MDFDISSISSQLQSGEMGPKEVASQVQAMFLEVLIKSMESSIESEGGLYGDSSSSEIYRGMLRQELAIAMSQDLEGPLVEQLEQAIRNQSSQVQLKVEPNVQPVVQPMVQPAVQRLAPAAKETLTEALPVNGKVSSPTGWRRDPITDEIRYHRGTDIAAPKGTPIQAVSSGRVVESGRKGGYGNAVVVESDDGRKMLYAHNLINHVRVGDRVRQGEVIAQVGSTGRSTGPHVHFEVTE